MAATHWFSFWGKGISAAMWMKGCKTLLEPELPQEWVTLAPLPSNSTDQTHFCSNRSIFKAIPAQISLALQALVRHYVLFHVFIFTQPKSTMSQPQYQCIWGLNSHNSCNNHINITPTWSHGHDIYASFKDIHRPQCPVGSSLGCRKTLGRDICWEIPR